MRDEEKWKKEEDSSTKLYLKVTDLPPISTSFIFGFQQAMLCISSLLIYPLIITELLCVGSDKNILRVQLISSTFVTTGIATILQTTLGLRLSVLQGPSTSFLSPLLAYKKLLGDCDKIEENTWIDRLLEVQGSLFVASIIFIIIGSTGMAGRISRIIGPITIVPIMILLTISIVPTIEQKLSLHWMSLVTLICIVIMTIYLEDMHIPIYYYSFHKQKIISNRIRLFGQFPYLISILFGWLICFLLTITNIEPPEGEARTDKNISIAVFHQSPFIQIPYPGQYGIPRINIGLCVGYIACCLSNIIENIGSYNLIAKISNQTSPPKNAINRAIIMEGIGSMISAIMGSSIGVTTYAENIALTHITRVASRRTMQCAGIILICLGLFTKLAAILASIPDALIGGILMMGVSMIAGVTLSNLKMIDLSLSRNLSIMGLSILSGMIVPLHYDKNEINTGYHQLDQILSILLSIKMLVGGVIAVILDNTVPGGTLEQRGLQYSKMNDYSSNDNNDDAYQLSPFANKILEYMPWLRFLPFIPSNAPISTSTLV